MKILKGIIDDYTLEELSKMVFGLYRASVPLPELRSEAVVEALKYDKLYNKKKGNYTDYIVSNVKSALIKYIKSIAVNLDFTDEDIGMTKDPIPLDFKICDKYITFFKSLTLLEKAIVVEYYFNNLPVYKVSEKLNVSTRRINNILDTYSQYVKENMKW